MNYLTNYYKNLSEQLQERINLLEARIYGAQAKVAAGNLTFQKSEAIDPLRQGLKRAHDVINLRAILKNKSHPIHQNREHVTALEAVLADIDNPFGPIPGSSSSRSNIRSDRHRRGIERMEEWETYSPFGSSKVIDGAQPEEMRFVVDLLKGKYDPNKKIFNARPNHDTNPTDEVPVYGEDDYDSDPPTIEDVQGMIISQPNRIPRSGREGGGVSPYYQ